MEYRWTCFCCGRTFDTLPLDHAFKTPDKYWAMSETEREARAILGEDPDNPDVCIIDGTENYVRGCIEIPVTGSDETFRWGVWARVTEAGMKRIIELWNATSIDPDEPTLPGQLVNWIEFYPEPTDVACDVLIQAGNQRPIFVVTTADYPLAVEQREGITLDRVKAFAANLHR